MILRRLVDRMNQNVSAPTGVFRGHCKWCYMSATTTEETHYKDCVLAELESIANGDAPPADAQPQATATKIECKHGCGQPLDQHYVERQFKDGRETYSAVKCPISPSDDSSSSHAAEVKVGRAFDECANCEHWRGGHQPSGCRQETETARGLLTCNCQGFVE